MYYLRHKYLYVIRATVVALLAVFFVGSHAIAIEYPQPVGLVTDTAGMLSNEESNALESDLISFQQQTGNEIAIVTVASLEGEPIEDYAVELFERWGIGQKEKDNGILILVSRDDREVRIEVGYGLEGSLNDAAAGRIIREVVVPAFREERYGEGLASAVREIQLEIGGDGTDVTEERMDELKGNTVARAFPLFIFGLIYVVSFLARSKRWWPGGVIGGVGGGLLGLSLGSWVGWAIGLGLFGLLLDFILSKNYRARAVRGRPTDWWHSGGGFFGGGGFGGSSGGGFGGFGGGMSGGGGASGRW